MKAIALLLLLLSVPANAKASEWTASDYVFEATFATAVVIDWHQTQWGMRNHCYETNPLLNKHPTDATLMFSSLGAIGGHALISYLLPVTYRRVWQTVTVVVEGGVVAHNMKVMGGLHMKF